MLRKLIFTATVIFSASANAQSVGPYAAIGAGFATSNADRIEPIGTNSGLIQLRAGYGINRYLAMEADASFTVLDGGIDPAGVTDPEGRLNLSRSFAGFGVARYPVGDSFVVFGRAGFHNSQLTLRSSVDRQSASFNNLAYGGGLSYYWGANGIRADYTVLTISRINQSTDNIDQHVIGLSYVRRF